MVHRRQCYSSKGDLSRRQLTWNCRCRHPHFSTISEGFVATISLSVCVCPLYETRSERTNRPINARNLMDLLIQSKREKIAGLHAIHLLSNNLLSISSSGQFELRSSIGRLCYDAISKALENGDIKRCSKGTRIGFETGSTTGQLHMVKRFAESP